MDELHIYVEEEDWVIAYSEEDATQILTEHHGCDKDDLGELDWRKLDAREKFTLYYDDAPGEDKPTGRRALRAKSNYWEWKVKATVAEWIELRGRGFFASSEY